MTEHTESRWDEHSWEIGRERGYHEGYRDGLAEPRLCKCGGDFDAWGRGFNAGWEQGYAAAVANGH